MPRRSSFKDHIKKNRWKIFFFDILWPNLKKKVRNFSVSKFLEDFFKKNLSIKFLCLLFAIVFSFYVSLQDVSERRMVIPLEIVTAENMAVANEVPKQIAIYVSGNRNALANFDINYVKAIVDVKERREGSYRHKPLIRGLGDTLHIARIVPEEIPITISTLERKLVEVSPEFLGNPEKNYFLEKYEITPNKLFISGPKEIIEDLTSLKTEPINLTSMNSDKEIEVSLSRTVHPSINVDRRKRFNIRLSVKAKKTEHTVQGLFPISWSLTNKNLSILETYYVTNVKLLVDSEYSDTFNPEKDVNFFFETSTVEGEGEFDLSVGVLSKPSIEVTSFEPSLITVKVTNRDVLDIDGDTQEIPQPAPAFIERSSKTLPENNVRR